MTVRAIVVYDLAYGDSGKARVVSQLVADHESEMVVKHAGGAQCAHRVELPDGRGHTFAQFGAGTLQGARTHIGPKFFLNPLNMVVEAEALATLGIADPLRLVTVDARCPIITPYHVLANRLRETLRGRSRHGSCGQGIGETAAGQIAAPVATLRAADLAHPTVLAPKLRYWRDTKLAEIDAMISDPGAEESSELFRLLNLYESQDNDSLIGKYGEFRANVTVVDPRYFGDEIMSGGGPPVVFESGQGVLLDEWYGFHPYTTWSTTGPDNAIDLLTEAGVPRADTQVIGVLRPYMTRHGAGPFPTEDPVLTRTLPDTTNTTGQWQGGFRVGHFDLPAAMYSANATRLTSKINIDGLAFTCCDRLVGVPDYKVCTGYDPDDRSYIASAQKGNLAATAARTALVAEARPRYRNVNVATGDDVNAFTRSLAEILGIPLAMTTWSPVTIR